MRIKKRKRRIEGKLTEDPYYTGYFTLPWEFTERSVALKNHRQANSGKTPARIYDCAGAPA